MTAVTPVVLCGGSGTRLWPLSRADYPKQFIKFKNNIGLFVSISYLISTSLIFYLFFDFFGKNIFTFFLIIYTLTLIYQLKELKKNENNRYLKLFKLNNFSGLLLFIGIFSINL